MSIEAMHGRNNFKFMYHNPSAYLVGVVTLDREARNVIHLVYSVDKNDSENEGLEVYFYENWESGQHYTSRYYKGESSVPLKYRNVFQRMKGYCELNFLAQQLCGNRLFTDNVEDYISNNEIMPYGRRARLVPSNASDAGCFVVRIETGRSFFIKFSPRTNGEWTFVILNEYSARVDKIAMHSM